MKKVIAGIVAFSAVASAYGQAAEPSRKAPSRTSVQVYGVADVAMVHYNTKGASRTTMHTGGSGSRFGILAGEDLGDGWRVNTRLEAGFNMNNGTFSSQNGVKERFWSRQAYIEVANPELGGLRLGRLEGPTYRFFPTFDPMLIPSMDSWGVVTTLGVGRPGRGSGTGKPSGFLINPTLRTENTIGYTSPRWSGLQAKVSYSLNNGSNVEPRLLETYVDYKSGPLTVGVLYVHASSTSGEGLIRPTKGVSEIAVGAKYEEGPIQPYFTYIHRSLTDQTIGQDGSPLNSSSESVKLFGAAIPIDGRSSIRLTYGHYSSGSSDQNANSYAIAYLYEFSRSILLTAAVTRMTQGSDSRWRVFQSPIPQAGEPVNGVTAGINWRF